ncbi:extracellular catalytic domain type 1 short-chain-length polyhydroxyalkanoate depolymerase [Gellertiella hungarica]|uniref:Poly(Hydroxyalkanoate) depolymerase family esterase n=1 Tax=Gellertiella hungarica TaxID=1572859 RepID=A0A7W6J391_9HYPH|nr:PHB depolymerase family esterase [Gellertiella hungarica]MBB4063971.1 poly(hydroxyalkanoate) depolymerase family esterase [Gellertiella hungarica]
MPRAKSETTETEGSLREIPRFGTNPGQLKAWLYLPSDLPSGAPLVVALHGCGQTAEDFARGTGWNRLADRHGFAVLYPEQQRRNNGGRCFNWFQPEDFAAAGGEVDSIRQMILHVVECQGLDGQRVFIMGLSAGAAMAHAMLATHPDLFCGGGIVAGLPYGVTRTMGDALQLMRGRNLPRPQVLADAMPAAPANRHRWPRITVWQGGADRTVRAVNAEMVLSQWRGAMGLSAGGETSRIRGARRTLFKGAGKNGPLLESVTLDALGHGLPLAAGASAPLGVAGQFFLDCDLSAVARMALFWGLIEERDLPAYERAGERPYRSASTEETDPALPSGSLGRMLEKAMKVTGFMR